MVWVITDGKHEKEIYGVFLTHQKAMKTMMDMWVDGKVDKWLKIKKVSNIKEVKEDD